jgi:hypothetical protein
MFDLRPALAAGVGQKLNRRSGLTARDRLSLGHFVASVAIGVGHIDGQSWFAVAVGVWSIGRTCTISSSVA